jgi:hypothetical protein
MVNNNIMGIIKREDPHHAPPSEHLGLFWREKNFKFSLAAAANET